MGEIVANDRETRASNEIIFAFQRSPDYKLEFINGAICDLTPRGEIVCDLHFECRERPDKQTATVTGDGAIAYSPFHDKGIYIRDVKFGAILSIPFAKDLITLLSLKIKEYEEVTAEMTGRGMNK
ncbi:MAG: hypothetical protein AB9879_09980 [Methanothrix sp.]